MKTIASLLILIMLALPLACCKGGSGNADKGDDNTALRDDIPAEAFSAEFDKLFSNSSKLTAVGDDYVRGMVELDLDRVSDYVLKVQTSGTEVDQYGIFKAQSAADAEALADSIAAYLDTLRNNWDNFNYLPEEMPKIKAAEVKTAGVYVVFVVASDSEKKAVFDKFDSLAAGDGRT